MNTDQKTRSIREEFHSSVSESKLLGKQNFKVKKQNYTLQTEWWQDIFRNFPK